MKVAQFNVGEKVLISIVEGENYNLVTASPERMKVNGKVGTVRFRTESGGNWYYKVNDIGYGEYLHEKMLLPVKLTEQQAETMLIKGEINLDTFHTIRNRGDRG